MTSMQYEYCPDPEDSDLVFNIPGGDDESNIAVEENSATATSDSDEAPDDVSFSKSKVAALSILKAEEQSKRITKEEQKKRRQKKEAWMKEQKAKTLQSLTSKRLPDNLVDIISAQPVIHQSQQDSEKKQRKRTQSGNATRGHIRFEEEHYIPLETGEVESPDFSVAILESRKWKNKFSKPGSSVPKDFRHRMLYGRSNRRQSIKDIEQARVKQALSGKTRWVVS